jgi:hypothetical protein
MEPHNMVEVIAIVVCLFVHYAAISWRLGRMEGKVEHTEATCIKRGEDHTRHFKAAETLGIQFAKLETRVSHLEEA